MTVISWVFDTFWQNEPHLHNYCLLCFLRVKIDGDFGSKVGHSLHKCWCIDSFEEQLGSD